MMIFWERFCSHGAADMFPLSGPVSAFICGCWAGMAPSWQPSWQAGLCSGAGALLLVLPGLGPRGGSMCCVLVAAGTALRSLRLGVLRLAADQSTLVR